MYVTVSSVDGSEDFATALRECKRLRMEWPTGSQSVSQRGTENLGTTRSTKWRVAPTSPSETGLTILREDKLNQIEQMTNLTLWSEGVHVFHVHGNNMLSIYASTLTSAESIDVYNKKTRKKARPDKVLTTDASSSK